MSIDSDVSSLQSAGQGLQRVDGGARVEFSGGALNDAFGETSAVFIGLGGFGGRCVSS